MPAYHPLRAIDRFVDLTDLWPQLAPFYSTTSRPSIDPELMIRMLDVGYCSGIRLERRLPDLRLYEEIVDPARWTGWDGAG